MAISSSMTYDELLSTILVNKQRTRYTSLHLPVIKHLFIVYIFQCIQKGLPKTLVMFSSPNELQDATLDILSNTISYWTFLFKPDQVPSIVFVVTPVTGSVK